METVLRSIVIYGALLIVFRLSGRRALAQLTNFDLVLLLIISEAIQNGLIGNDYSLTNALLTVVTLVTVDLAFAYLKEYVPGIDRLTEGRPIVIVEDGRLLEDRMKRCRVDVEDILEAARDKMGLERMEDIRMAVLERTGDISIIPVRHDRG